MFAGGSGKASVEAKIASKKYEIHDVEFEEQLNFINVHKMFACIFHHSFYSCADYYFFFISLRAKKEIKDVKKKVFLSAQKGTPKLMSVWSV